MLLDEENKDLTPSEENKEEVEGEATIEETTVTETTVTESSNEEEKPIIIEEQKDDKKKRNIIIIIIIIIVIIALVLALVFGLRGCNNEEDDSGSGSNNNEPETSEPYEDDGVTTPGSSDLGDESDEGDGSSSGEKSDKTGESGDSSGNTGDTGSGNEGEGDEPGGDSGSSSGGDDNPGDDGDSDEDEEEEPEPEPEPEPEKDYPFEEEDTTGYDTISLYNLYNGSQNYVYYSGERVTVSGATVVGQHGKTLTLQQYYSGSYYTVEVDALSLPEGVKVGASVNVIGTVTTKYGKRVVLDEARVQVAGTGSISAYAKIRLIDRDAENYYYYSGGVIKHEYRVLYEVEKDSEEWTTAFSELDLYRAFKVEWRNWYKPSSGYSTGTDRGETYLVVYNDISEETKNFYDIFFDGTSGQDEITIDSKFDASWTGVAADAKTMAEGQENNINSYHWFEGYTKFQYYYGDFYVGFDEFEAQYITNYNYTVDLTSHENITAILSGFFDDGDEVTVTGILMEQHGRKLTLQEYDGTQGGGYCLEVEPDSSEYSDDIPKLSVPYAQLITVKGTVRLHESPTLLDYTHTLENCTIQTLDGSYGTNSNKTRMYYGGSSISSISSNIYGEYSAAYFHAGVQIYALPSSWNPDDEGDYWFIGRLRYKNGSITYLTSEYIPVVIHSDEQEGEMGFWEAVINGNKGESNVKISKTYYDNGTTYVTYTSGAPEVGVGFTGIDAGEIIMSNFFQVHYFDEEKALEFEYSGTKYEVSDDRYLSMDFNTAIVATFSSNLGVEDD